MPRVLEDGAELAQIGIGSSAGNATSIDLPAPFSTIVWCSIMSKVAMLSPAATLRTTPRWPWMNFGSVAM